MNMDRCTDKLTVVTSIHFQLHSHCSTLNCLNFSVVASKLVKNNAIFTLNTQNSKNEVILWKNLGYVVYLCSKQEMPVSQKDVVT